MSLSWNVMRPARRLWSLLGVLTCLFLSSAPAQAACVASPGTVSLGTVSSFAVAASAQNAAGSTGFACTGSFLSLISTNTVTATISSTTNSLGNQPRLFSADTGDYIPFTICKEASCSGTYPVGSQVTWSSTTFIGLLGLFNAGGGTLPIYIRTTPGTQIAAGTYTSTINLAWTWHLCSVGLLGACVYDDGTAASSVTVTMIVTKDCLITAPSLDFGSAPFAGSFDPVSRTIVIRCSKGAAYSTGINNGLNYLSTRRLALSGAYLNYEIYFPENTTARWGAAGAERRSSAVATGNAGLYTGIAEQTYTYKAQIIPGQPTPAAGTYTDTLIVDVQF